MNTGLYGPFADAFDTGNLSVGHVLKKGEGHRRSLRIGQGVQTGTYAVRILGLSNDHFDIGCAVSYGFVGFGDNKSRRFSNAVDRLISCDRVHPGPYRRTRLELSGIGPNLHKSVLNDVCSFHWIDQTVANKCRERRRVAFIQKPHGHLVAALNHANEGVV